MEVSVYLLPCIALVLSSPVGRAQNSSYHHFQLVQTWPKTFCFDTSIKCVKPLPPDFTMHGLWPADSKGNTLKSCGGTDKKDLISAMDTLESDLNKSWPSIRTDMPGKNFWGYQWFEHGTCSAKNPHDYFRLAIEAKNKFSLGDTLKAANIIPSNRTSYKKSDIENAVKQAIGKNNSVYISCRRQSTIDLLFEIYICLDGTVENYISCPQNKDTRGCGGVARQAKIKYPVG